jgi:hypothetical protein
MSVRQTAIVKIGKRIQNGAKHFPGFPGREGPFGKDLGESFIGVLGYDVEQILTVNCTASGMKKRHQVRMGEGPSYVPPSDGSALVHKFEREDFDGGSLRAPIIELG